MFWSQFCFFLIESLHIMCFLFLSSYQLMNYFIWFHNLNSPLNLFLVFWVLYGFVHWYLYFITILRIFVLFKIYSFLHVFCFFSFSFFNTYSKYFYRCKSSFENSYGYIFPLIYTRFLQKNFYLLICGICYSLLSSYKILLW